MSGQKPPNTSDDLLLHFLRAGGGPESDELLAALVAEQTETTIKGVIRSRLHVSLGRADGSRLNQDALDLLQDVQASLVAGLRDLKSNAGGRTISNLHGYVASIAFNACHQYLRRKYPRRFQLKNRLRYLLTHRPGLALWEGEGGASVCGLDAWRDAGAGPLARPDARTLRERKVAAAEPADLCGLVSFIFGRLGAPLLLEDLVTIASDLLGLKEPAESANGNGHAGHDSRRPIPDPEPRADATLEQRTRLRQLWAEVLRLPQRHRAALLLNLRGPGGECVISLLPLTRVATIRQIAEALSFAPEQFAQVWNELPWDDQMIARHLGLTRQQVINLRQSARSRLARRAGDL